MFKLRQMILMLCFILTGAFGHAHGVARMERKCDGRPIELIENTGVSSSDRGSIQIGLKGKNTIFANI